MEQETELTCEVVLEAPHDAQYEHGYMFYKKGQHGFVFVWLDDAWFRTLKPWMLITKGRNLNKNHNLCETVDGNINHGHQSSTE